MFPILKDSIIYLIAVYIARLFSFVCKIIVARILEPAEYGLWSIFSLILLYGGFLDLGSMFALVKEISFYSGQRKQNEIDEIKNTVFFSTIITAAVTGVAIFILSIFFAKYENRLLTVFSLIAFILILNQIRSFFICYFVAVKKFKVASVLIIYSTFFFGILAIILVMKFGLIGLPLGISIGNFLILLYVFNKYKLQLKFQINIKRYFSLIKIGFPIMLLLVAYHFFLTIDRILIFKYIR